VRRWQIVLAAAALDAALGDPPWRGHPARLMGRLAAALERPCRGLVVDEKKAGVVAALAVVGATLAAVCGVQRGARRLHPVVGDLTAVVLVYWALAARDLAAHAEAVARALASGDLDEAQQAVARMVGRDTAVLDEEGVVRAAVESVAENTVDGVLSPLFYAFLGGAPAALAFKAISTLDSTFGYKNHRYLRFGWASARADDAANYLPARLAVPLLAGGAALLGLPPGRVFQTVRRDGRRHASPNSGLAEAAFAGALGVRLGGPLLRGGRPLDLPYIGRSHSPLSRPCIGQAVRLMWAGHALALLAGVALSFLGHDSRR
jgi:adenosylcobinamide-phosphate synthase